LLLAEAAQEQGRPIDSLTILEALGRKPSQAGNQMIEVLKLSAHQRLSDFDEYNAEEAIAKLKDIVRSSTSVALKARALTVGALLVHDLQLREPVESLLELSNADWPLNLDEETAVRLVVARALLRQVNGADGSLAELEAKVEELRTSRLANLAAVQLVHCLSAANCSHGNYPAGLEYARLAQQMAVRIGNDLACAAAAANLALCHGRLGNYAEQGKWAVWGQQSIGKTFVGYREIRLGLTSAFSSAMLGSKEPALSALDRVASRIPAQTAPWIIQAWKLGKADVLRLCGLKREAIKEAGTVVGRDGLLNTASAGPYARWLVALALAKRQATEIECEIRSMREKLHTYEALDQVEILASELLLLVHIGKAAPAKLKACQRRIEERLSQFPIAVSQQLTRLGALSTAR
jgi:cell division protein ZapA (FtsZ GTPase activity inhibitor)